MRSQEDTLHFEIPAIPVKLHGYVYNYNDVKVEKGEVKKSPTHSNYTREDIIPAADLAREIDEFLKTQEEKLGIAPQEPKSGDGPAR